MNIVVIQKDQINSLREQLDAVKGRVIETPMSDEQKEQVVAGIHALAETLKGSPSVLTFGIVTNAYKIMEPTIEAAINASHLARTDALTGILNKAGLFDAGNQRIAYSERHNHATAVFFADLTKFKPINDQLGHEEGDAALKLVAQKIVETVRKDDIVGRYGGDEFVIIMTNEDPDYDFSIPQKKLQNLFENGITYTSSKNSKEYPVGADLGMAIVAEDEDAASAITRADKIMYKNKQIRHRELAAQGVAPEPGL